MGLNVSKEPGHKRGQRTVHVGGLKMELFPDGITGKKTRHGFRGGGPSYDSGFDGGCDSGGGCCDGGGCD